jgi:hypothetical protein
MVEDAFAAVFGDVQEAGNGKAALGAAIGEERRGEHEVQIGHMVIEALGVGFVVRECGAGADEGVLRRGLAGEQVALFEGLECEFVEKAVAGEVDFDFVGVNSHSVLERKGRGFLGSRSSSGGISERTRTLLPMVKNVKIEDTRAAFRDEIDFLTRIKRSIRWRSA